MSAPRHPGASLRRPPGTAWLLLAAVLCVATQPARAAPSYVTQPATYNWIDASKHTPITTWDGSLGCVDAAGDDSLSQQLSLGFTFTYGTTAYSTVRVFTNGRLQFGSTYCSYGTAAVGPPRTYPDGYPTGNLPASMKIYGADLDASKNGGGKISYATVGTAPNRLFVVTWTAVPQWSAGGSSYSLQMQLAEDGTFYYMYGSSVDTVGGTAIGPAEVGWELTTTDYAVVQQGLPANASGLHFVPNWEVASAQWHFDESSWSGTKGEVVDSGGSGYHATAQNGATTAGATPAYAGSPGTCSYGSFDGKTGYVQMPTTLPKVGNVFTVTAWIRPIATAGGGRIWIDDENYDGYALSFGDPGGTRVRFFSRSPSLVTADSAVSLGLNQWYFVAGVMDATTAKTMTLYIFNSDGALIDTVSGVRSSFSPGTGTHVAVGGNTDTSKEGGAGFRFPGYIDEVSLYPIALTKAQLQSAVLQTHPCAAAGATTLRVTAAATGLYCLDAPVTVTALDAGGNPVPTFAGTVTLSTTSGRGTWLLTSGGGTFVDAVADDGLATYTYSGKESAATFALRYRAGPATLTVNATETSPVSIKDDGTQGSMTFSPSGFTVTSSAFTNPAGGVPAFASPQVAGNNVSLYLTAYGQTPNDATCGIITTYAGARSLKFWSTYVNPATGTVAATVNASAIATAEAGAAAQSVTFASGQAVVTAKYKDAGSLSLSVKDDTTGNPALPTGMRGSTGTFVSRPADFVVSGIKRTSDAVPNPAAATASGTVFIGAGRPFTATVTAVEAGGATTPNFGRETPAESVRFDVALVLPASGNAPAVSGTAGAFTNGVATGTAFAWPEAGIVRLVPRIADGSYLAAGDVVGSQTGNVGRFVPDSFAVALNTPLFGTACAAGGYSYVGQPLTYTVAPVVSVTAQSFGGTTTQNYTGALFRLTNASLTGRTYTPTPASPALDTSGLPATSADPAIVDLGGGQGTLTFSAGSGLKYARGAAIAPFSANIALAVNVLDLDGVAAANPVTFGSGTGMGFSAGTAQRYGRLLLRNATGSELLDLPLAATTQYYASTAQGFVTNTDDACTTAAPITFSGYQSNLTAGATCVRDSGSPGVSGAGCAVATAQRYRSTAAAGDFNLVLAAPGAGHSGAVTVTATAPTWLQYLWNQSSGTNSSPAAMATFGVFPGPTSRIYQREVY